MSKRLLWTESNTDRIRRATIHGTRIQDVASVPRHSSLRKTLQWPRAVEVDNDRSCIYVAEYLGRIWEFSMTNQSQSRLLVDSTQYAAALDIRSAAFSSDSSNQGAFLRISY